jgi:hypothetical protein
VQLQSGKKSKTAYIYTMFINDTVNTHRHAPAPGNYVSTCLILAVSIDGDMRNFRVPVSLRVNNSTKSEDSKKNSAYF